MILGKASDRHVSYYFRAEKESRLVNLLEYEADMWLQQIWQLKPWQIGNKKVVATLQRYKNFN